MPIIQSAKKRVKVTNTKTEINAKRKKEIKFLEKDFKRTIAEDNFEEATKFFNTLEKKYHQASEKNLFHKNKSARKISQYQKMLNSVAK
jgi:small subunit ribosomal protein S20